MKKIATLALCVLMLALTAPVIQAATPQAGAPKADKPAKVDARSTPVWVELEGTDSIGARLGSRKPSTAATSSASRTRTCPRCACW